MALKPKEAGQMETNQQNIIVAVLRKRDKAEEQIIGYISSVDFSSINKYSNFESDAFVFNTSNKFLSQYPEGPIQIANAIMKQYGITDHIIHLQTPKPETKHESNGWVKEYIKKTNV